jgi:hypothetical protein
MINSELSIFCFMYIDGIPRRPIGDRIAIHKQQRCKKLPDSYAFAIR